MRVPYIYNNVLIVAFFILTCLFSSCTGEDRSDEMPLVPSDVKISMQQLNDSCIILKGTVGASHNNALTKCGFYWGNSTKKSTITATPTFSFDDTLCVNNPGKYYAVAFATNYMGTTLSDTLHLSINK